MTKKKKIRSKQTNNKCHTMSAAISLYSYRRGPFSEVVLDTTTFVDNTCHPIPLKLVPSSILKRTKQVISKEQKVRYTKIQE